MSSGNSGEGWRERVAGAVDFSQLAGLIDDMPRGQLENGVTTLMAEYVVPHFVDVREAVAERDDASKWRAHYHGMSEAEKQRAFETAFRELAATLAQTRQQPVRGALDLKTMIRNPAVVEALLLAVEDEQMDEQYAWELKSDIADQLKLLGIAAAPEMYREEEAAEHLEAAGIPYEVVDPDPDVDVGSAGAGAATAGEQAQNQPGGQAPPSVDIREREHEREG